MAEGRELRHLDEFWAGNHLETSVKDILGPGLTGTRYSLEGAHGEVWRAGREVCT